jgi:hypothetical protein
MAGNESKKVHCKEMKVAIVEERKLVINNQRLRYIAWSVPKWKAGQQMVATASPH